MPKLPRILPPERLQTGRSIAAGLLIAAGVVLAAEPVRWLVQTWADPAYDSNGSIIAALVAALLMRSAASPLTESRNNAPRCGIALIAVSASVRLAGQLLAINTIGALTLVLDVYAIGLLLRLNDRRWAISPAWLAIGFAFCLPLERIVQRSIGHVLQHASADGACTLLGTMFDKLECAGVRILVGGRDVLVDLPCSGARTALLTLLAFSLAATVVRPSLVHAAIGGAITLSAAYAANVARIAALSIGIARPELLGGIDVMAAPWHEAIGLVALAVALLPILAWARGQSRRVPQRRVCRVTGVPLDIIPDRIRRDGWWLGVSKTPNRYSPALAIGSLVAALVIVSLPGRPLDVARREAPITLPGWISGHSAVPVALMEQEARYFTLNGGAAAKASYGPHSLMIVRTTSPLRHLHAPDECLRGLGFAVRYVGLVTTPVPTAVYSATAPDGSTYRIDVSFVSERRHAVANVAAAVWLWLNGEAQQWTAIQRISPAAFDLDRHNQWSAAALAALGLEINNADVRSHTAFKQENIGP
jgi:exosortase/archaeosortase family protein